MKKYPTFDEWKQRQTLQQKCDALKMFQSLLLNSAEMNEHYHGKAESIAYGLQPWIEALELSLGK